MRALIIIAGACFITVALANEPINMTKEQEAELERDLDECIKEENATVTEGQKIKNWDIDDSSQPTKCVFACFLEKFGVLKDNEIQAEATAEKLKPIINDKRTNELVSRCKDLKGVERCETGFQIFKCMWNYRAF